MILRFELQRGVLDLELAMQVLGRLFEERTVAVVDVSHQMGRERGFGGAHWPNVEVMHLRHMRKAGEILSHFADVDTLAARREGEVDGVTEQTPRCRG